MTGKKPTTRKRGRPSKYTAQIADDIIDRIREGESLAQICRTEGYPTEGTVRGWAVQDREGFSTRYDEASRIRAHAFADQVIAIADDPTLEAAKARLMCDARKWVACKLLPKIYGDKQEIEHTGKITLDQLIDQSHDASSGDAS